MCTQERHPQINVIRENAEKKVVQLNVELQADRKTFQSSQQATHSDHNHFRVRRQLNVGLAGVQ